MIRFWSYSLAGLLVMAAAPAHALRVPCTLRQISDVADPGRMFVQSFAVTSAEAFMWGRGVGYPEAPWEVYAADLDDGVLTNLTGSLSEDLSPLADGWGRRVLFSSNSNATGQNPDGNLELFVLNRDTGSLTQLTQTTVAVPLGYYHLAYGGHKFLLVSMQDLTGQNPFGSLQLFSRAVGAPSWTQVTTEGIPPTIDVSFDLDGTLVVFSSQEDPTGGNPDGNEEIFSLDTTTGELTQITHTLTGSNSYGRPAAGGQKIAFITEDTGLGPQPQGPWVVLFDRVSGIYSPLFRISASFVYQLIISGDASRIAFADGYGAGIYEVSTGFRAIIPHQFSWSALSSDGRWVAFSTRADLTGQNPEGDLEAFVADCPVGLFGDDFERGDASRWTSVVPGSSPGQ